MCHLHGPLTEEFVLSTKVHTCIHQSITAGSHLKTTVTSLSQEPLNGQMHLSAVQDWVSITLTHTYTHPAQSFTPLFFCEGATLASIEDPSEQEFIKKNIFIYSNSYSSFWIGLYRTHSGTVMSPGLHSTNQN